MDETIQLEQIDTENKDIPETPLKSQDKKQKRKEAYKRQKEETKEEKEQTKKFLEAYIRDFTKTTINITALKKHEKITSEEIEATKFPETTINLIFYYLPNLKLDHPLLLMAMSTSMLTHIIMTKKQLTQKGEPNEPANTNSQQTGKVIETNIN